MEWLEKDNGWVAAPNNSTLLTVVRDGRLWWAGWFRCSVLQLGYWTNDAELARDTLEKVYERAATATL